MQIRSYASGDCAALRQICCDTADRGGPVDHFFRARDVVADMLLRYYIEEEPGALWVAEMDGRVVGYLTGCLDGRRYQQAMHRRVVPTAVIKAIGHGALWQAQTWLFFRDGIITWLRGGLDHRVPMDRYPAHLHVNVQAGFRGAQIGRALMEQFFAQVRAAGLPGVHAVVREDNPAACAFFERLGFARVSRHPSTLVSGQPHYTVIYGKTL